jgi:hypothetical protein
VKEDINELHEKFNHHYQQTFNSHMSEVRDIPPVSGQIIWARQLERQLNSFLSRVQFVLGKVRRQKETDHTDRPHTDHTQTTQTDHTDRPHRQTGRPTRH